MKTFLRLVPYAAVASLLLLCEYSVKAFDASETFLLDRYTILTNGTVRLDQGYLLRTGHFKVVLTEDDVPLFGTSLSDIEPISGRPIMYAQEFDAYKAAGVIPKWVRSRYEFPIGIFSVVIVAVSGKGDPNPLPVIHEQPKSQRILVGDDAWLEVDASPDYYLSYQWKFKNKTLTNRTSSILFIQDFAVTNRGVYTVTMDAGGKPVVSHRALLTPVLPAMIKTQPLSRSIINGKNVVFRVAVQGTGPFTYQWYFNGVAIPNATKSYYTVVRANDGNEGIYKVLVSNGLSFAVSDAAVLTVNP